MADRLCASARRVRDGSLVWLDPAAPRGVDGRPARLGANLYGGVLGTALFLAAAGRELGRGDLADTARRALAPVRAWLREFAGSPERAARVQLRLGGLVGLGGYIYGFLHLAGWLAEPALIEEARDLAVLITAGRIAADRDLDVLHGSAGAALALLALHRADPGALADGRRPLEIAAACGEHLLERRVAHAGEPRAWPQQDGRPLCGFAHGAAGVAYALARLYEESGREPFLLGALEGIAFERHHFDERRGNWRDLRGAGTQSMTAWCHGAAGIALGRLRATALAGIPEVEEDVERGLAAILRADPLDRDFVCCGNLGRAEILLEAHRLLGDGELLGGAHRHAGHALVHAREHDGRFRCLGPGPDAEAAPAFFTGLAGIGYALLRFAGPDRLPCVLGLEACP